MSKTITMYLHSDKEDNLEIGLAEELTEEQLKNFKYACYEVKLTLEVDDEGNAEIIAVDDRELM